MRVSVWFLGVLLMMALVGCSPKPTFVGTWSGEATGGTTTITFNADGTYLQKAAIPLGTGQSQPVEIQGKYTPAQENKELTMTIDDVKLPGLAPALVPMVQPMIDQQKKNPIKATVEWIAADEIRVSLSGQNITLKRSGS